MDKCLLCNSSEENEVKYGEFLIKSGISVHTFCLYLSSNLSQNGTDDEGVLGFLLDDIEKESQRTFKVFCCYCGQRFANIGCCQARCYRSFHLVCGIKHGVENQFTGTFKSYCDQHVRKTQFKPSKNDVCCICYEELGKQNSRSGLANMVRAPCCRNGWFHKFCLQVFANTAGYFFKCPLCNDNSIFRDKLPYRGIFIPNRDAAWELEPNAFAELLERPSSCSADICHCHDGRKENNERNPLLLCITCGSVAMHRYCMSMRSFTFNCDDCCQLTTEFAEPKLQDTFHHSPVEEDNEDIDVDICNMSDINDSLASDDESIKVQNTTIARKKFVLNTDNDDDDQLDQDYSTTFPKQLNQQVILIDDSSVDENHEEHNECNCGGKPMDFTKKSEQRNATTCHKEDVFLNAIEEDTPVQRNDNVIARKSIIIDELNETTQCSALPNFGKPDVVPEPKPENKFTKSFLMYNDNSDSDDNDPLENFIDYMEKKRKAAKKISMNVDMGKKEEICDLNTACLDQPTNSMQSDSSDKASTNGATKKPKTTEAKKVKSDGSDLEITHIGLHLRRKSFYRHTSSENEAAPRRSVTHTAEGLIKPLKHEAPVKPEAPVKAEAPAKAEAPVKVANREKKPLLLDASCIASRTRRSFHKCITGVQQMDDSPKVEKEVVTPTKVERKHMRRKQWMSNSNSKRRKKTVAIPARVCRSAGTSKNRNPFRKPSRTSFAKALANNPDLELNCIASRTRRKSGYLKCNNNNIGETDDANKSRVLEMEVEAEACPEPLKIEADSNQNRLEIPPIKPINVNKMEISCVANRTRRKSICSMLYNYIESVSASPTYHNNSDSEDIDLKVFDHNRDSSIVSSYYRANGDKKIIKKRKSSRPSSTGSDNEYQSFPMHLSPRITSTTSSATSLAPSEISSAASTTSSSASTASSASSSGSTASSSASPPSFSSAMYSASSAFSLASAASLSSAAPSSRVSSLTLLSHASTSATSASLFQYITRRNSKRCRRLSSSDVDGDKNLSAFYTHSNN